MTRRIYALALIVTAAFAVFAPSAFAACPRTSLPAIEDEVMCPICGVPLVNAGGPQAENERDFIREHVDRCATKQEIKNALVAEYGDEVLAVPSDKGFELAAYVVPIAGLAGGLLAISFGALRWRRARDESPAPPSGNRDVTGSDAIDDDIRRYDL